MNSPPPAPNRMPCPGVHRLTLPLTGSALKYINVYLLPGEDGHLLIDTGWKTEDTFRSLTRQIGELGLDVADIARIVITHAHIDHYGLAARLRRVSGAVLILHEIEKDLIALRYREPQRFAAESNRLLHTGGIEDPQMLDPRGFAERFRRLADIAEPDIVYRGGERLRHGRFDFQLIWTPGHSPGHLCLYDAEHKLFFSGDHVLPQITPNIGLYPQSGPNPLADYIASLQSVKSLEVRTVFPSHGPPFGDLKRRTVRILDHHSERKGEILDLLKSGSAAQTAYDLVTKMTWHSKGAATHWQQLPPLDQRLAMFEVMAHLEAMAFDDRLVRSHHRGVVSYRPARLE